MLGFDRLRRSGAAAVLTLLAMLAVLLLCSVAWGADGPQEYVQRAFVRGYALSDSSLWIDGSEGDRVRCFSVSLTDTTNLGTDMTYLTPVGPKRNWRYLWRFGLSGAGSICNCYEIAGTPDTLLWGNAWIPGKGYAREAAQWTTNAQGRIDFDRSLQADSVVALYRVTAADAVLGAGAIGTSEVADSSITAAKIPANSITEAKIGTSAVGTQQIAASAVTDAKIGTGISVSKLASASASTNNLLAWNGSAWAPTGSLSVSSVTASGTAQVDGNLTAGSDSTDVVRINGRLDLESTIYKEFTVTSGGGTLQTFAWAGAKSSWRFFGFWVTDPSVVRTLAVRYSSSGNIDIEMVTGAIDGTVGVIAIRPSY